MKLPGYAPNYWPSGNHTVPGVCGIYMYIIKVGLSSEKNSPLVKVSARADR